MFAVTVWASVLPPIPLALMSLVIEGPEALLTPILHPTLARLVRALLYGRAGDVAGLPHLGHAAAHLSRRARSGPISLLVPCCALVFASLLVDEPIGGLRLLGVAIVLGGVAIGMFASGRRLR